MKTVAQQTQLSLDSFGSQLTITVRESKYADDPCVRIGHISRYASGVDTTLIALSTYQARELVETLMNDPILYPDAEKE